MSLVRASLVVLLTFALSACGGDSESGSDPATTMAGRLAAPECTGGFDLVNSQVILRDESDDIIGTATTGENLTSTVTSPCVVFFEIEDVPRADFYTISIGSHEGPAWSYAELRQQDFKPELAIGGAEMPTADPTEFCADTVALRAVFDDIDMLNERTFQWNEKLRTYSDAFEMMAAGIELEGDDIELVDPLMSAAATLQFIDGAEAAKPLNEMIEPINAVMVDVVSDLSCPYWDPVVYSAG